MVHVLKAWGLVCVCVCVLMIHVQVENTRIYMPLWRDDICFYRFIYVRDRIGVICVIILFWILRESMCVCFFIVSIVPKKTNLVQQLSGRLGCTYVWYGIRRSWCTYHLIEFSIFCRSLSGETIILNNLVSLSTNCFRIIFGYNVYIFIQLI